MKLRAENIVKKYRNRTVVKGVSIELEQGEIVRVARSKWCRQNYLFLHDRWAD